MAYYLTSRNDSVEAQIETTVEFSHLGSDIAIDVLSSAVVYTDQTVEELSIQLLDINDNQTGIDITDLIPASEREKIEDLLFHEAGETFATLKADARA